MDLSEKYLMMCRHRNIQESWDIQPGDFFFEDLRGTTGFSSDVEKKVWPEEDKWSRTCVATYKSDSSKYHHVSDISDGAVVPVSFDEFFKQRATWLPRIDQIHTVYRAAIKGNMIDRGVMVITHMHFNKFLDSTYKMEEGKPVATLGAFETMSQIWLAFMMYELHNLKWTGKSWNFNE